MIVDAPQALRESRAGSVCVSDGAASRAPWQPRLTKYSTYVWRRMLRVRATPHEIALGCAAGVFAACTPFLGFQMALAAGLSLALRVSIPAALLGTFIGNPLSWPAIWSASYVAGAYVLGLDRRTRRKPFRIASSPWNSRFARRRHRPSTLP